MIDVPHLLICLSILAKGKAFAINSAIYVLMGEDDYLSSRNRLFLEDNHWLYDGDNNEWSLDLSQGK